MDAFASVFLKRKIYLWMDILFIISVLSALLKPHNRFFFNELGVLLPKVALYQVWLKLADMDRRKTAAFSLGQLKSEHRTTVIVAYMQEWTQLGA